MLPAVPHGVPAAALAEQPRSPAFEQGNENDGVKLRTFVGFFVLLVWGFMFVF